MSKIYFNRYALHAVSLFSAREDIRYFLNGILVEATANTTRLIATDGHTMGIHQSLQSGNSEGRVIIPIDVVDYMLLWSKVDIRYELTIADECRVDSVGAATVFKGVDGKFPDYKKVVPESLSGEPGQFNPMYIARCAKAGAALKGQLIPEEDYDERDDEELREFPGISATGYGVPAIGHNGLKASAVVSCGDANLLMVVMPMDATRIPIADFAWAKADQP